MKCALSSQLLAKHALKHINYLSLDIEGAELSALKGIDWSSTTIDLITIENSSPEIRDFLKEKGMEPALCVSLDTLYARKGFMEAAAASWYTRKGVHQLPDCITNVTDLCIGNPTSFLRCSAKEPGGPKQDHSPEISRIQRP